MNDIMMMDSDSYPAVGLERTDASMQHEAEDGEWNERRQSTAATATTLAVPSIARNYSPVQMEGALRVMSHAGRILWRAAMEAIPGGVGSYNPSIDVLSKLWKLSFRKTDKNDNRKSILSTLPFGKNKVAAGDKSDVISAFEGEDDDAMQTVPDSTIDSYYGSKIHRDIGVEFSPEAKKRKKCFGISSLLPSVVSDSEEEEDDHNRPSKRFRRTFEDEPVNHYW